LAFRDVASWQQSEKVEQNAQLHTFLYRTPSKSFLYSNAFLALTDKQTDKKLNVFGCPGGG